MENLSSVMIEVTQRCNMTCAHCLRGESRNKDMNEKTIEKIFRIFTGQIPSFSLTGGEPTLAVKQLEKFVDEMRLIGGLDTLWFCTNAKRINPKIYDLILHMKNYCDEFSVSYSNDKFHDEKKPSLQELRMFCEDNDIPIDEHTRPGSSNWMLMGKAADNCIGNRGVDVGVEEDTISIDVDGNIYPSCNLSYRVMEELSFLKICNVNDLVDFDDFMDKYDEFNSTLMNFIDFIREQDADDIVGSCGMTRFITIQDGRYGNVEVISDYYKEYEKYLTTGVKCAMVELCEAV